LVHDLPPASHKASTPQPQYRSEKRDGHLHSTTNWVAVHGNAVISDAERPVNIAHHSRFAIVTPKVGTEHWSTGVVHFALPSAPSGSMKPIRLITEFETTMARPYKVEIFYGGSEVCQVSLSERESLNSLDISCISPFGVNNGMCGHGINVVITISFRQTSSSVSFESVGMIFEK
jgi:hypothetical protein